MNKPTMTDHDTIMIKKMAYIIKAMAITIALPWAIVALITFTN